MAEMWSPEKLRKAQGSLERGEIVVSRELLHQALQAICHPLGPFTSVEAHYAYTDSWYRIADKSWLPALLDLAENPPLEDKYHPAFRDIWDIEVSDLIVAASRDDPRDGVERVRPLLTTREGRFVAISVLNRLGTREERLRDLGPLLISFSLTEEEIFNLVEAFGNDPSAEMQDHFQSIRSFLARDWSEVLQYTEEASSRPPEATPSSFPEIPSTANEDAPAPERS